MGSGGESEGELAAETCSTAVVHGAGETGGTSTGPVKTYGVAVKPCEELSAGVVNPCKAGGAVEPDGGAVGVAAASQPSASSPCAPCNGFEVGVAEAADIGVTRSCRSDGGSRGGSPDEGGSSWSSITTGSGDVGSRSEDGWHGTRGGDHPASISGRKSPAPTMTVSEPFTSELE